MNKQELTIREFKNIDYKNIQGLWRRTGLGGEERGDDISVIKRSLDLGGKLFVLEDISNKKLIGTSWMTFDGRRLHLHHLGIDTEFQGRGYSRILLKKSLAYAVAKNIQVKLEVHAGNFRAIELYKSTGFKYLGDYDIYIIRNPGEVEI